LVCCEEEERVVGMNVAIICRPIDQHHEGGFYCSCSPRMFRLPISEIDAEDYKKAEDDHSSFEYKKHHGNITSGFYTFKV